MIDNVPYRIQEIKPLSFIYEIENAIPADACRRMIELFEEKTDQHYQGRMGQEVGLEQTIKRSTDLRISGKPDWKEFDQLLFQSLSKVLSQLAIEFPFFAVNKFRDMGYQLQRTQEGEYYHWHIDGGPGAFSQRQLVIIWYLNDVAGPGGETEFAIQDIKVKPQAGKMVIFPPFWTHIHRGVTVEKGVKYIATTWVNFA